MSDDRFREWDAAYILGALTPAERKEYEQHLRRCEECSAAVGELAVMPALLSSVPAEEAEVTELDRLMEAQSVPPTLMPRLVESVTRRRRRSRVLVSGILAATVAATASMMLVLPPLLMPLTDAAPPSRSAPDVRSPRVTELAMTAGVASPLSADLRIVSHDWGTTIEVNCRYSADGRSAGATDAPDGQSYAPTDHEYSLYLRDDSGTDTQLATWTAGPGSTVEATGTTSLTLSRIATVEVRSATTGDVLLVASP